MTEKMRWRIAHLLDRLPWTCWTNLVTWALGWNPLREIGQTDMCRRDAAESGDGCCYCSKISAKDGA